MEPYKIHLGQLRASERKLEEILEGLISEKAKLKKELDEAVKAREALSDLSTSRKVELDKAEERLSEQETICAQTMESLDELGKEMETQKMIAHVLRTRLKEALAANSLLVPDSKHQPAERWGQRVKTSHYAIVLIDGDGMRFHDGLVKDGRKGGEEACKQILQNARSTLSAIMSSETSSELQIQICIYASIEKLSGVVKACGISDSFRAFSIGITRAAPFASFVDVGEGKEIADSKIKDMLRWHYNSPNCKAVILGASHDNGYALPLTELDTASEEHKPIVLVEGSPFAKELEVLEFVAFVRWDTVFSNDKYGTFNAWTEARHPSNGKNRPPSTSSTDKAPSEGGWETQKGKQKALLPKPKNLEEACTQINSLAGPERLCFHHYLKKECTWGVRCAYVHDYRLSPLQTEALMVLSKRVGDKTKPKSGRKGSVSVMYTPIVKLPTLNPGLTSNASNVGQKKKKNGSVDYATGWEAEAVIEGYTPAPVDHWQAKGQSSRS